MGDGHVIVLGDLFQDAVPVFGRIVGCSLKKSRLRHLRVGGVNDFVNSQAEQLVRGRGFP
ncbi:hypothetical protein D3C85_1889620 [compost metagenome]